MQEIDALVGDFSKLASTQPLSSRARELEIEELALKKDFSDLVKCKETEISKCHDSINKLTDSLAQISILVKNTKRHNRESLAALISVLKLMILRRRAARIQALLVTIDETITPVATLVAQTKTSEGKSWEERLKEVEQFMMLTRTFPKQMATCKSDLEKRAKMQVENLLRNFRGCVQTIILNSNFRFDPNEVRSIAIQLAEKFGCPAFTRLLANECCACVDSVARNSAMAVSDEANATTVILSLCEFVSVLRARISVLKDIFGITGSEIDNLFGDKICRELIKFLAVHRFAADEHVQAVEIFNHLSRLDQTFSDRQVLHHCLEPFNHLIDRRLGRLTQSVNQLDDLAKQTAAMLKASAEIKQLEIDFSFFADYISTERQRFLQHAMHDLLVALDLTLPAVDRSDVYDSQERSLLHNRFPTVPFVGERSQKKRSRERLAAERLAVMQVFEKDGNSEFKDFRDYMLERFVSEAISDALTAWSTGILAGKDERRVASVSVKFATDSEQTLRSVTPDQAMQKKLLSMRSRLLAEQALETLGLIEDNQLLNLTAVIPTLTGKLGDCTMWTLVKEYEAVLKNAELELEECLTWCLEHKSIPLRLLAVVISKHFNSQDDHIQQVFERLESAFY